jgi:exodeoxyribonuclease V alpha subunit
MKPPPDQRSLFTSGAGPRGAGKSEHTLEGEVVRITYENDSTGFRVIKLAVDGETEPRTLVGVFPPTSVGSRVRATGKPQKDEKRGDQFRVETLLQVAPTTIAGLEKFLGSGVIHGVGPVLAKRIVEAFGTSALDVLDNNPDRLREVEGLGGRRAEQIQKTWESHRALGAKINPR